jgi:signal peptidase I
MKRASLAVIYILVGLIFIVIIFAAYRHYQGDLLLSVQTGSMVPTFLPGDAVVTRKVSLGELQVGDIITYRNPAHQEVLVSHRLISVNHQTGKLITEGDALNLQDIPFPYYLVVGRVTAIVPSGGYVLDWLHRPIGLLTVVYIPAALILLAEARRLARQYAKPYYQLYSYEVLKQRRI